MSDTLEPFLSNRIMELMTKVMLKRSEDALETNNDSLESILMNYENCDEKYHAGCEYNFALFLPILKWDTQIRIPNEESNLANIIKETWQCENYKESFTSLYNEMNKKAISLLNPGWVFLTYNTKRNKLHICVLDIHDNPLCYCKNGSPLRIPLFAWNLWEHAYYLQYEYRKTSYIKSLWYITDWSIIEKRFDVIFEQQEKKPLSLSELKC